MCYFQLTGLALLIVGIWSKISLVKYMKLSTSIDYNLAPYIMIGCGSFIILVGILGCWACLKEHSWALILVCLSNCVFYLTINLSPFIGDVFMFDQVLAFRESFRKSFVIKLGTAT